MFRAKHYKANKTKEMKSRRWIGYIVTFVVLSAIALSSAWVQGAFAEVDKIALLKFNVTTELQCRLQQWSNAFAFAGALGVCFGILVVVKNGNLFDLIVKAFRAIVKMFRQDKIDRKYNKFYKRATAMKEKNNTLWYILILGAMFVALSAALIGAMTVA